MTTVAVVILNWNGKKYLKKFLPSVIKYSAHLAEIVVADNNSSDDSVPFIKESFPEVRIIENEKNEGFARGYNQAFRHVNSRYYVLLNSDIEVTPGWLEPLIQFMDANPGAVACQPKIKAYHNKDYFEYAGAAGGFLDKYAYPFCRGRIFHTVEKDQGQYDDPLEVFWATGACMITPAKVYHELSGLDDYFFAHMEEIDYCWRAKNLGYTVHCIPQSTVYHVGGGTLPKNNPYKTFLNFRNNLLLIYKNNPPARFRKIYFTRIFLDALAAINFLVNGQAGDFSAVIRAHFHFLKGRSSVTRQKNTIPWGAFPAGMLPKSILNAYFLKKKKTFSSLFRS